MPIDETGVQATDLESYVSLLEEKFKDSLGQDLDVSPETPQGQLIGLFALALTNIDEDLVALSNGMSLNTAAGNQLDAFGTMLQIFRRPGTPSEGNVTFEGTDIC